MPSRPSSQSRPSEAEKVTLNLQHVDLGQIDLAVREGFYANRSDFIRTAIRRQIDRHEAELRASARRLTLDLGIRAFTRVELERARDEGRELHVKVLGLCTIARDVTPALARATIGSLTILGTFDAAPDVRRALADRLA